MRQAFWLLCGVLLLCPVPLWAQKKNDVVVVMKDGFTVKGKVAQKKDMIFDPYSGKSFSVPAEGSSLYIDDLVRRIMFPPTQVQDIIEIKEPPKEFMVLHKPGSLKRGLPMLPGWRIESISDWSTDKWSRVLKIKTEFGRLERIQRITDITPYSLHGFTVDDDWVFAYLVQEFPRDKIRAFAEMHFAAQSNMTDFDKRLYLAKYLQLAGWYDMADKELEVAALKFPGQEKAVKDYRDQVRKQQIEYNAGELERKHKAGMHEAVQTQIEQFRDDPLLSDKHRLLFQEMKLKYDGIAVQIAQVQQYLKEFLTRVSNRKLWSAACQVILDELNPDTVERLTTFLRIAEPHAKELRDNRKPTQKTEEVLALAVSGWLQGDSAALPDVKAAVNLYRTREFVLSSLRNDSAEGRSQALAAFTKQAEVPIDVMTQLLRFLPPTHAYTEKLDKYEPTKLSIEVPDAESGKYFLQLPPEYNPQRSYPVLVLLQSNREKADVLLKRWQSEAARYGFILAAPLWGQGPKPVYQYSKSEHDVVLDTVRDLRRRFNVDSDRVFLFGWEEGANAAFDIGLSHPDQFAGVLPMNGTVTPFSQCYWSNAQYLPFYVVEGDRNGGNPKAARGLFKEWLRGHYPSIYVEYKGRSSQLFLGEIPNMMDWMSRKKRVNPTKGLGRYHTGGGVGEEFKTLRMSDNRFYWLSTDDIASKYLSDESSFTRTTHAATLQATMAVANVSDIKTGARIATVFHIRTSGIKQVTLSLSPTQVDFSRPVSIRINNRQMGAARIIQPYLQTMLEELYATGDRQRLVAVRLEFRL
jgi:pimeloyl-ACP methyl ester carboxylesterase